MGARRAAALQPRPLWYWAVLLAVAVTVVRARAADAANGTNTAVPAPVPMRAVPRPNGRSRAVGESDPLCRQMVDGTVFDLNPLATESDYVWEDLVNAYRVNFCHTVVAGNDCRGQNAGACMYSLTGSSDTTLMSWSGSPPGVWSWLYDDNHSGGIKVTFANAGSCPSGGLTRTVVLNMPCVSDSAGSITQVIANQLGCRWTISFPTTAACIGAAPPEPPPDSGGMGVSVGTIFCVCFGALLSAYVAVGCCYKRRTMGAEGMESCPNVDFWRELPLLVRDGCAFAFKRVFVCYRPNEPRYEDL